MNQIQNTQSHIQPSIQLNNQQPLYAISSTPIINQDLMNSNQNVNYNIMPSNQNQYHQPIKTLPEFVQNTNDDLNLPMTLGPCPTNIFADDYNMQPNEHHQQNQLQMHLIPHSQTQQNTANFHTQLIQSPNGVLINVMAPSAPPTNNQPYVMSMQTSQNTNTVSYVSNNNNAPVNVQTSNPGASHSPISTSSMSSSSPSTSNSPLYRSNSNTGIYIYIRVKQSY